MPPRLGLGMGLRDILLAVLLYFYLLLTELIPGFHSATDSKEGATVTVWSTAFWGKVLVLETMK